MNSLIIICIQFQKEEKVRKDSFDYQSEEANYLMYDEYGDYVPGAEWLLKYQEKRIYPNWLSRKCSN